MRLTIVGASGSFAGPDSPASCYLVRAEANGRTYSVVFDLGNGALGALQRYISPWELDALFLTHLHPDHCVDCTGLYVYRKYDPAPRTAVAQPLPVHGPAGTQARLAAAYEGIDGAGMTGEFAFVTVTDGAAWRVGPITVTAFAVNHPVEAYGYRVEADGAVLAYTGDTDSCPALASLGRDADLMLADCAFVDGRDTAPGVHLSGGRAAQAALEAGARRLMLTHIPAWSDPELCRAQAAELWPGEVELARAGATYEIVPAEAAAAPGA